MMRLNIQGWLNKVKANVNLSNIDNSNDGAANNLNSAGIRTVIKEWHSGTTWYRRWSDGWKEMGGYANVAVAGTDVNLPSAFSDANYTAIASSALYGSATINTFATPKSASVLTVGSGYVSATKTFWYACGY